MKATHEREEVTMTRAERDQILAEYAAAEERAQRASQRLHAAERALEALFFDPRRRQAQAWADREAESGQAELVGAT